MKLNKKLIALAIPMVLATSVSKAEDDGQRTNAAKAEVKETIGQAQQLGEKIEDKASQLAQSAKAEVKETAGQVKEGAKQAGAFASNLFTATVQELQIKETRLNIRRLLAKGLAKSSPDSQKRSDMVDFTKQTNSSLESIEKAADSKEISREQELSETKSLLANVLDIVGDDQQD